MRLFVAVNPGRLFREALASGLDTWRQRVPLAWVPSENWHVTLHFLGETPESTVEALTADLIREARLQESFVVHSGSVAFFPNRHAPRVLFLQMDSGGALESLAAGVRRRLSRSGQADNKVFRAHLTLARIRRRLSQQHLEVLADLDPGDPGGFRVRDFQLLRSHLLHSGAVYDDLATFSLGGGR